MNWKARLAIHANLAFMLRWFLILMDFRAYSYTWALTPQAFTSNPSTVRYTYNSNHRQKYPKAPKSYKSTVLVLV